MSAETCRRFNGKQQCRRRSGKCVQLRDWFMVRHSSSRHVCMYTYYHVRPNTSGESKKHPPKVKSRDGHICGTCVQNFRSISYKKSWTYRLLYGKHAYFRWLLVLSWFQCRIEFLRHILHKIYHRQVKFANVCVKTFTDGHALNYLQSPRSDKNGKKRLSYGNT